MPGPDARIPLQVAIAWLLLAPGGAVAGGDLRPHGSSQSLHASPGAVHVGPIQRLGAFTAARQLDAAIRLRAIARDTERGWIEREIARRGSPAQLHRYLRRADAEDSLDDLAIRSRLERSSWPGAADLPWLESQGSVERVVLENGLLLRRLERREALRQRGRAIEREIAGRVPQTFLGHEAASVLRR